MPGRGWKWIFMVAIAHASCLWKPITPIWNESDAIVLEARNQSPHLCNSSEHYIPWGGVSGNQPMRVIRLNFHFMNSRDSTRNLTGEDAVRFATELVKEANYDLAHNQPMRLPLGNSTPVLDPLLRYKIARKATGQPAIYEHFDDAHYYLVKRGRYRNNYDTRVIDQYGVGLDSILNVFIQVPPPDSMMGENYGGLKTGVALRNGIRISGPLLEDARVYTYSGMFNHEVGHVLGLRHSWVRDQCEDTPEHPNCWNFTNDGSVCDSLVSNNVMDSNADQDALTPCQIGIMQQSLTTSGSRGRGYLRPDHCRKQDLDPIRIRDTVEWCREMDVVTDIVIGRNSQLIVSNRLSIPAGGRIYIEKKGKLVLRSTAVLHNACGLGWEGIFSRSGDPGQIVVEEGARIVLE